MQNIATQYQKRVKSSIETLLSSTKKVIPNLPSENVLSNAKKTIGYYLFVQNYAFCAKLCFPGCLYLV